MNDIQIISASAGSGKTYKLTSLLEKGVVEQTARPQAVLATTFTNKAAAELQEKVRVRLLQAGHTLAAQQVLAARMGTVNSVCGRLVGDFAFDLGLSPQLRVLDEEPANVALHQCIAAVLTPDKERELQDLSERMVDLDWQEKMGMLAGLARANMIDGDKLAAARDRSWQEYQDLLGKPRESTQVLDAALLQALKGFLTAARSGNDATAATAKAVTLVEQCLHPMERGQPLPWSKWVALVKATAAKASNSLLEPVRVAASAHDRHPRLHADIKHAIELVFDLTASALDLYQQHKREMAAIDFVDQETYALELLGRPEVQEQLAGELDLVLIDEFQDTSPIQLAIFLRLAKLAKRSIWVGDQKQAIYGFRGADPALMDAAISNILKGQDPETLPKSYRSRPGLVQFTCALFAPAFALQAIPPARVPLQAELATEPPGLGAFVECWPLTAKNKTDEASALTACIKQLLEDKTVYVRDRTTELPRVMRPSDVAILSRTNEQCLDVAEALAELGIRPVLPRQGLLATLEGRALLAALRLWVDSGDALSAAELARLVDYADREDRWLQAILEKPGNAAFAALPMIVRLRQARDGAPHLGVVAIFDAVAEAIGLPGLCAGWGDADARMANAEAFRSHVVNYINGCTAEGMGCTAAGLVAYLVALEEQKQDSQGVDEDDHSVVVTTWHKAKGLEWPIVVLYPLYRFDSASRALGVHVETSPSLTLDDPLADRWIRFWPNPYHANNNATPLHDRLAAHAATASARSQAEREDLRLLYVGWTRARDRIILADREGEITDGLLQLLRDDQGPLVHEPDGNTLRWAEMEAEVVVRKSEPLPPQPQSLKPGATFAAAGPKEYPPAFVQPSGVAGGGLKLDRFEQIGSRMGINGDPDWSMLGMAVHGIMCADRAGFSAEQRTTLIKDLLSRWDVSAVLDPIEVAAGAEAFRRWVDQKWPGAQWCREWPVLYRDNNGSVIRGNSDLALRVDGGLVIIDHKSFPGSIEQALSRAAEYAGQLRSYATAVETALGQCVLSTWIHLAVTGIVVPIPL